MVEEPQKTAEVGSEPTKDTAKGGAVPSEEGKTGTPSTGEEKPPPFDKDPRWKSARQAEAQLQSLLKANDLDTVDELVEIVDAGNALRGRQISSEDLDGLVERAETLKKYEAYWKDQEERKKREEEDPHDTLKRLDEEKKELLRREREREDKQKQVEKSRQYAEAYDSEVTKLVSTFEDVPESEKPFVEEFFGVNNPASSLDITDRKAIRSMVTEGRKRFEELRQTIIKNYVAGKSGVVHVPSSTGQSAETVTKIKNLREARKAFLDQSSKIKF